MPRAGALTIVLATIVAIAITALGFAGAIWGTSWFMHSHFIWMIVSSAWFQGIFYAFGVVFPIYVAIMIGVLARKRTRGDKTRFGE